MERLTTEVLFRNPWHAYRHDRVRRRDGSEGDYFSIDHPASIAVVAAFPDATVLVQRCFRYLLGAHLPQLVLGHTDPAADQAEEARRELGEETGFEAASMLQLGRCTPMSGLSNEVATVFLARDLSPGSPRLDVTEELEVLRLSHAEARAFLLGGPLLDGQSLSAWFLYEAWLAREEHAQETRTLA